MTAERTTYTGNANQTPNPAKPRPAARLDLDAIRTRANAATTGPWGVEANESILLVLNRALGVLVATAGAPDDTQATTDAEFIASAREDIPALLDEITALDQTAEDAVALTEQIGAELRAARTEIERLRRLLDTRDSDYALVVRVDNSGRSQVDGSPGLTLGQAAEWLQELATDTARRAGRQNTAPDEYRYCGGTFLTPTEDTLTCDRRVGHGGECGPYHDPDPAHVAPALCSARCPHGHDHTCARSPQHFGPHRNVKQKGHESCSWTNTE